MFSFTRWLLLAALALSSQLAAQPPLTVVQDILYTANGSLFNGAVTITWTTFRSLHYNQAFPDARQPTSRLPNGNLYVQLVPTTSAKPSARLRQVEYNGEHRTQYSETWIVPPSTTSLRVRDVRLPPGAVTTQGPPAITLIPIADVVGLPSALQPAALYGPNLVGRAYRRDQRLRIHRWRYRESHRLHSCRRNQRGLRYRRIERHRLCRRGNSKRDIGRCECHVHSCKHAQPIQQYMAVYRNGLLLEANRGQQHHHQ